MRKSLWAVAAVLVALTLILAACGGPAVQSPTANSPTVQNPTPDNPATKSPAATVMERYYAALVSKDAAKVSNLTCKDFEEQALLEMDSFQAVKAELDNVVCTEAGTDSGATLVGCTGTIVLTYNNENQTLDVSRQVYRVVQQAGDYLVCGYK
jgi:ABC-type glycerol-3-phosphate transport system substrate-binding protein